MKKLKLAITGANGQRHRRERVPLRRAVKTPQNRFVNRNEIHSSNRVKQHSIAISIDGNQFQPRGRRHIVATKIDPAVVLNERLLHIEDPAVYLLLSLYWANNLTEDDKLRHFWCRELSISQDELVLKSSEQLNDFERMAHTMDAMVGTIKACYLQIHARVVPGLERARKSLTTPFHEYLVDLP